MNVPSSKFSPLYVYHNLHSSGRAQLHCWCRTCLGPVVQVKAICHGTEINQSINIQLWASNLVAKVLKRPTNRCKTMSNKLPYRLPIVHLYVDICSYCPRYFLVLRNLIIHKHLIENVVFSAYGNVVT